MKIITLCGSTKFKEEYDEINKKLTLRGNIVISCGVWKHQMNREFSKGEIDLLEEIHFRKIDLADEIFIINPNNYIGKHTKLEIDYAKSKNKKIRYLKHDFSGDWMILTCKRCNYIVAMRDTSPDPFCEDKLTITA